MRFDSEQSVLLKAPMLCTALRPQGGKPGCRLDFLSANLVIRSAAAAASGKCDYIVFYSMHLHELMFTSSRQATQTVSVISPGVGDSMVGYYARIILYFLATCMIFKVLTKLLGFSVFGRVPFNISIILLTENGTTQNSRGLFLQSSTFVRPIR
jgi:hypothetical protein